MAAFSRLDLFGDGRADLGEGPCWHAARGTLWWIDITGQRVLESRLDGGKTREWAVGQMVGCVAPERSGGLVAALHDGIYRLDPDMGVTTPFARAPGHDPAGFRFNDGKIDPQGRLWAGTLSLTGARGASHLYSVDASGAVTVRREGVSISNGLAWSVDGGTLYYIDSPTRRVQAFRFDGETGALSEEREASRLADDEGWPDGCCLDEEGMLWVGHWGAGRVTRRDPRTGRVLETVRLPVRNVTSCAFAGERLDRLFITTAVDHEDPSPEPEAGRVFCLQPGVAGWPTNAFAR
jgi:sugar lactone lactonase YvrE